MLNLDWMVVICWVNLSCFKVHFISEFSLRAYQRSPMLIAEVCVCEGGWIGSEIGKTMERYDPEENKWEIIGSMAVPRYYFGCCELQGMILHLSLYLVTHVPVIIC